jgi:hypothetical protein
MPDCTSSASLRAHSFDFGGSSEVVCSSAVRAGSGTRNLSRVHSSNSEFVCSFKSLMHFYNAEKRRRKVGPGGTFSPVARRREKVEWQRQKSEYYARGSFYGRACGLTLYRMAHLLNRTKNELLW